ncbi:MAG: hypothetical protein EBT07_01580 [Actinobacteria bacterium]|nr:hypothetical protein [Actinomycetota bacterium]
MATDLKKFLDAKKADTRLLGDVERHLLRQPLGDRSTTVLHPSEIIKKDWCHRYAVYLLNGGKPKQEKPNLRLQNIFDEGHSIHAKWQGRFQDMGVLYGRFMCLGCSTEVTDISPAFCETCTDHRFEYKEVTLVDPALRIAGHTDGWIKGIGDDCLIEIKSIGPGTIRMEAPDLLMDADGDFMRAWKNIRRPFRPHLMQGQMYLELAHRMFGKDAPKEIVFIYELKADQDYKEFTIKANYDMIDRVFFEAEKVVKAATSGVLPECNVNAEFGCKSCQVIEVEDAVVGS